MFSYFNINLIFAIFVHFPEVPGPVRSEPVVTDRTKNRISLQWDRPAKPETVLVYRVEARSADEECWRQVRRSELLYRLLCVMLNPLTFYYFFFKLI